MKTALLLTLASLVGVSTANQEVLAEMIEVTGAQLVTPPGLSSVEQQAVTLLTEEVGKRTALRWQRVERWPENQRPVIVVGSLAVLSRFGLAEMTDFLPGQTTGPAEGFHLRVAASSGRPVVLVAGNDSRGVMFGVGRLLRELRMTPGRAFLPNGFQVTSAPKTGLRGHQLGYRPKTNTYDAWDISDWEQYLRDLVVFGCNAIELIPPRSDDDADSPHFPRPPMEMMVEMSRLADRYGLDVWIWYPAMDRDYSDAATVERALKEWSKVFQHLPRIDAVFVPGGDPGHTQPRYLMALLEKQTARLKAFHPRAQMWVSPQGFDQAWMEEFLGILREERPAWLNGVVYGPQVRLSLSALRERVPPAYPIRHYPDITHSRQSQYPVPDWDVAYAVTEGRECINPRPLDQAVIYRSTWPHTIGFITYSEGCNDDVNKTVWSALGWDPNADLLQVLREYSRYFIGERFADGFAQGLLALEQNWRGPLLANAGVDTTLQQFQTMERAASPRLLKNWRFQQGLFRAYYDAYVRHRLIFEMDLEQQALDRLRRAPEIGSLPAMADAEQILNRALRERPGAVWHDRLLELGDALFQSIGMQLSVPKYQAIALDRGAALDTLDYPLNNRPWLKDQFAQLRQLDSESERLAGLRRIVAWENPGAGGFYDDLGAPGRQPHLVRGPGLEQDPGSFSSPRNDWEEDLVVDDDEPPPQGTRRVSWQDHAEILYDAPLRLRYTGLDPEADYRIRVVYAGDSPRRKIRLVANDTFEVHGFIAKPRPYGPVEFDIPPGATRSGILTLSWQSEPGLGGNGRACQVSEVWLMRKSQ